MKQKQKKKTNEENNVKYRGETIPETIKYTYLDIELHNELDYEEMAKYRTKFGYQILEKIKNTFSQNGTNGI